METTSKGRCEYLRSLAKQRFDKIRGTWVDCGKWAAPHRIKWLLSQQEGERNNNHIVDPSHILALRSYVAGFLEGNTSASRPWFRQASQDPEANNVPENKAWIELYTKRMLNALATSNFYNSAGQFYYDFGVFNTGAHYIDEMDNGSLFFHNLTPGSYYVLNNAYGVATVLVREYTLTVKAVVDRYGPKKPGGSRDWSNISSAVRKMYDDGNYTQMIDIVTIVEENEDFDPAQPQVADNRQWVSKTYEVGGNGAEYIQGAQFSPAGSIDPRDDGKYLEIKHTKRKPFIVGRSESSNNFEYGEKGPTLDALGLIKSLNKKAIGKDQALEQMLRPALQGPANLKKSYITTSPNSYIPLDATSLAQKGLRTIFEVNPNIGNLIQDVSDLRQLVDRLYYADYLLYLSRNPRTRTATETNAIMNEQQLIIGPNLQSLNTTYNVPIVDYVADYVLFEDPYLPPPPPSMRGKFLKTEFISVFAQAQKAADLPSVDRYVAMVAEVGALRPEIWDKVNLDKLADLYEDRLFLPSGLNNPQAKVDAMREQAMAMAQQQQMLQETIPAMAGAAKDVGLKVNNQEDIA